LLWFAAGTVGRPKVKMVKLCNSCPHPVDFQLEAVGAAFSVTQRLSAISINPMSYVQLPVTFAPPVAGEHEGTCIATCVVGGRRTEIMVRLHGTAKPLPGWAR
jgi:hypothetical protein